MKKILSFILALTLLLSLTACKKAAPAQSIPTGKYVCYQIVVDGAVGDAGGEWLRLDPDGKGRISISAEADIKWELDGKNLIIQALGGPYHATIKGDELVLDWGGTMLFFAPEGKLVFSTESTQQIPHTEPTETEAPTESEAPTGPDYSAASVVDAATAALTYDGLEMEYHVPMIVFEGEGIDYLNAMIYAELYDGIYTEDVTKAINEYGMPGVCYITYIWGISDEYLSIVVTITPYATEGAEFHVYNVDLSTGEFASQVELLSHFGYTVDSFNEKAKDVMGSVLFDNYASFIEEMQSDPMMIAEFDDLVSRTTSDEYVSDACAFVGADGKLWMVAPIASVAGADCYNQVIEFESYPISDAYLNYIAG